jgi:hypothetical protein
VPNQLNPPARGSEGKLPIIVRVGEFYVATIESRERPFIEKASTVWGEICYYRKMVVICR